MLFFSASINTIQPQPSCQGRCSGPAAGCYSQPLQTVVYFDVWSQFIYSSGLLDKTCIHKQVVSVVSRCKCRYPALRLGNIDKVKRHNIDIIWDLQFSSVQRQHSKKLLSFQDAKGHKFIFSLSCVSQCEHFKTASRNAVFVSVWLQRLEC